jgi:hypothetical protein
MGQAPTDVSVRMYQIAFGDCFLLSVRYAKDDERHVLIDFGQKGGVRRSPDRPPMGAKAQVEIAGSIAQRVGDAGLAGVVVTHRHEDHLSGFGIDEAAAVIADLKPKIVMRSWTEDPDAPRDAGRPAADRQRFLAGLDASMQLVERLRDEPFPAERTAAGRDVVRLAANQIANRRAIENLEQLGRNGRAEYLSAASPGGPAVYTGLAALLPGVEIDVLGPPRPEVWERIRHQRENDPDYWLTMRDSLSEAIDLGRPTAQPQPGPASHDEPPAEGTPDVASPAAGDGDDAEGLGVAELVEAGPARWLVDRLRRQQLRSLFRIVRWLDGSLNNTSVVLLFRVGDRRLLFPGDAQIENWLYALTAHPEFGRIIQELAKVDLYKVGHHGSRNATPIRLYDLWAKRSRRLPLLAMMSTLHGVYGESDGTFVPNARLTAALRRPPISMISTESLGPGQLFVDVTAPVDGRGQFKVGRPRVVHR